MFELLFCTDRLSRDMLPHEHILAMMCISFCVFVNHMTFFLYL